jgi:hypothetical protein
MKFCILCGKPCLDYASCEKRSIFINKVSQIDRGILARERELERQIETLKFEALEIMELKGGDCGCTG